MKPVKQDQLYDPLHPEQMGNCWQAVIASVLDLPLDAVPHFVQDELDDADPDRGWLERTADWLAARGQVIRHVPLTGTPGEYLLASGPSPRGVTHVVVYLDGAMVHDPHPSGDGLLSVSDNAYVIRQGGDEA